MRTQIGCAAILAGMMGIATGAAAAGENNASFAGKRGLSPIIQDVPVMIAQANQAQSGDMATTRTMGVCSLIPNGEFATPPSENRIGPTVSAGSYLYLYERQLYEQQNIATSSAVIAILQKPEHGILNLRDQATGAYTYLPEKGYFGKDSATFLVDIGGIKVKVVYFFQAVDLNTIGEGLEERLCKKGAHWKISTTLDPNGNSTLTSVEYQSPITSAADTTSTDTAALAATLGLNFTTGANALGNSIADPSSVTLNLAPLAGGAVGQAVGTTITLDDNAAGYNWFIDTTPADNSEYLPTSNPNEWVAKEGTDAYGKIDMLSVLLHEYGHALGIEHSADNHDYMATTLTPGVRRMPSADELALMQQLVAQAKGEMTATASTLSPALPLQGGGGFPTLPL